MIDYDYEYEWDRRYCYPNSNVLINKLNITDRELLSKAEREFTSLRLALAETDRIKGKFDFAHLKRIHHFLFQDIYSWAGKPRTVNISKGNMFCLSQHLETYADNLFRKLEEENYLIDAENIPERLAYYLSEINVLHPFREGNGRTQRLFIEYLASVAGYGVDFSGVSQKEMILASADSFARDYERLNDIFNEIASPLTNQQQESAIAHFFGRHSIQMDLFHTVAMDRMQDLSSGDEEDYLTKDTEEEQDEGPTLSM